jgi:hypothetical protein
VTAWQHDYLGVIVEACVDCFCGRPLDANPYNPIHAMDAYAAWTVAWKEAEAVLEMRGQEEAARWLREAA